MWCDECQCVHGPRGEGRGSPAIILVVLLGAALLGSSGCSNRHHPDMVPPGVQLRDDQPAQAELAYSPLDQLDECYEAELMGCDGWCGES